MSECPDSDAFLLQAVGRGDLTSFSRIVERHQIWAWRIAYRFTGDRLDASDIVQEAFLRLLDVSARYRPTAGFRTYFYRIISRLCLDHAKKKRPLLIEIVPDTPDLTFDITETMMRKEKTMAVRAALDALPPNQRLAIVLRYYENLGYAEIALALSTTAKAVERLLARGRKHLNAYLDGELPERVRFRVERHLARCPSCLHELDGLSGLAPFLENNDVPPVPAGLPARILAEAAVRQKREQVQKMSGRKRQRFLFRPWQATGATTAALITGLAMGAWMGWTSYLGSGSAPWMSPHEVIAENMYAFDVLGAEPQGSIEAATLAFLDDKK